MVLPTGAISLGNLQTEYGGSNPAQFSEYYAGGLYVPLGATNIPASGSVNLNAYRGRRLAYNYITVGTYTITNPKFGTSITYYGWDTGAIASTYGSINSTSVYMYSISSAKFGDIPQYSVWRYCVWTPSNLYIGVNGDIRSSGPDNFRVGNNVIARTAFTRTYISNPGYTQMSYSLSTNPFPSTANNRCRVNCYYNAYGEPAG